MPLGSTVRIVAMIRTVFAANFPVDSHGIRFAMSFLRRDEIRVRVNSF